jgi:outer membrane protein OmpA-like peptidoglycan-associated protein
MRLRSTLLATTLLLAPGIAAAQPVSGLYIGGGAGVNWLEDVDLTSQGGLRGALGAAGIGQTGTASFETGWVGVLSLGWGFGNGLRAEIEGNYRDNGIDGVSGFSGIAAPRQQSGNVQTYGVMANVFYDFNLGPSIPLPVTPYIGGGIGYAVQNWDNVRISSPSTNRSVTIDGDNGNFAWQGIVGVSFNVAQVPGLAITAEGRVFGTLSDDVDATFTNASGTPFTQRGAVEVDNINYSLLLGVRYAFNQPAPPPPVSAPVAQAPAPARTYLVFFDWDRADLNDRARQIVAEAAQNSTRVQTTRIEVSGHADRSGTPQYNQRLSQRRADAVAAELERRGVPRSAIVVQAFGESRPLVPTADGVREPQNRRVEIVLR